MMRERLGLILIRGRIGNGIEWVRLMCVLAFILALMDLQRERARVELVPRGLDVDVDADVDGGIFFYSRLHVLFLSVHG